MAYALTQRDASIDENEPQRWAVRITLDAYPNMALETEYDDMDRADADDAASTLDATVSADPVTYFGPAPA